MHTTNYVNTFIEVADDCRVETAKVPLEKANKSIAQVQFEMISEHPYQYTSDDVIFSIYARRNQLAPAELDTKRAAFFAKGQACLRASPLGKSYGWGIHHNAESKVAIYAVGSADYTRLRDDPSLKHVKAMKSSR